ncbi:MAG: HNH endonuclease signature motif containing protein [Cyanobacteria bacterium J06581_3]
MTYIPVDLRRQVLARGNNACEYCLLPDSLSFYPHEVDHVIATKHGGKTELENLAYACWRCNRHKGSDLGSFDPATGKFCFLFNPRRQLWSEHFQLKVGRIDGCSPEGRTTIRLLQLNTNERVKERQYL